MLDVLKDYNIPDEVHIIVSDKELWKVGDFNELSREQIKVALSREEMESSKGMKVATFIREDEVDRQIEYEKEDAYDEGKHEGFSDADDECEEEMEGREEAIIHDMFRGDDDDPRIPDDVALLKADNVLDELKLEKMKTIFKKMSDQEIDELYDSLKNK